MTESLPKLTIQLIFVDVKYISNCVVYLIERYSETFTVGIPQIVLSGPDDSLGAT